MMSEFEKVIRNFKIPTQSTDHLMSVTYNHEKFINVYDRENDYAPARIINITNDPDGIAIEIKYIKDDTTRCYLISDETDIDLPENDQPHNYFYKGKNSFDYLFITENQKSLSWVYGLRPMIMNKYEYMDNDGHHDHLIR